MTETMRSPLLVDPLQADSSNRILRFVDAGGKLGRDSLVALDDAGNLTDVLTVNYTPAVPGEWAPAPTTLQDGLDQLAATAATHVVGPGSATDNAICRFDLATGKLIQNSLGILDDAGVLTGLTKIGIGGTPTRHFESIDSGSTTVDGFRVTGSVGYLRLYQGAAFTTLETWTPSGFRLIYAGGTILLNSISDGIVQMEAKRGLRISPASAAAANPGLTIDGVVAQAGEYLRVTSNGGSNGDKFVVKSDGKVGTTKAAPVSDLDSGGSIGRKVIRVTSTHTAGAENVIHCDGTFPVNLPAIAGIGGRMYYIVNVGTGVITINPSGAEKIMGEPDAIVDPGDSFHIVPNAVAVDWRLI